MEPHEIFAQLRHSARMVAHYAAGVNRLDGSKPAAWAVLMRESLSAWRAINRDLQMALAISDARLDHLPASFLPPAPRPAR